MYTHTHTHLNDALHEVLLCDGVSTLYHLFEHIGQDLSLVHPRVDGVELRETDKVRPDEDPQLESLLLSPLLLPRVTLVLHTNPQLVHLGKVVKDERNGVFNGAILTTERERERSNIYTLLHQFIHTCRP